MRWTICGRGNVATLLFRFGLSPCKNTTTYLYSLSVFTIRLGEEVNTFDILYLKTKKPERKYVDRLMTSGCTCVHVCVN